MCGLCGISDSFFHLFADGSRKVHMECLPNGKWRTEDNTTMVWREKTECEDHHFYKSEVLCLTLPEHVLGIQCCP